VIGDDSNVLAAKGREFLRFENIKAGLYSRGATRMLRCGARGRER